MGRPAACAHIPVIELVSSRRTSPSHTLTFNGLTIVTVSIVEVGAIIILTTDVYGLFPVTGTSE